VQTSIYPFEDVFEIAPDGVPVVKRKLLIRGLPLLPRSRCRPGFRFAGIDITEHLDQPIVVFDHADHLEFLGFASFKRDQKNEKWVKGWGVVDHEKVSLHAFFPTKEQADEERKKCGARFVVVYGSKRIGSNDDFIAGDHRCV